jgi:IclR family mhp operon transcriptional activator
MRDYKVKPIRALERGIDVLMALQSSNGASLHDLFRLTGLPKATLLRIIITLEKKGLIWQRLADGAYLPSHAVYKKAPHHGDEAYLVEVAAPILERLCSEVNWPSVLAVPRLDAMEVIETNRPKSYFHHIPVGPIGVRVNMLRSATGRAYISFCGESERAAIIERLKVSGNPENYLALQPVALASLLEETRRLGYGCRYHDFHKDGRNSLAVPIRVSSEVIAAVNLTWTGHVMATDQMIAKHLRDLRAAADQIGAELSRAK